MAINNLGRVAIRYRGTYNPATAYKVLDCVKQQGSLYICIQDGTGKDPITETLYWDTSAERGASAYEQAVTGGYSGTLEQFCVALNAVTDEINAAQGASVVGAEFDGNDILFTLDDLSEIRITGGKTAITPSDGVNAYVHIRYSADEPDSNDDMLETISDWMGIYSGVSAAAPVNYTDYVWHKIKGDSGASTDISVSAYGAVGDGTTPDDVAIAAAISAAPAGGTVQFEPGKTYLQTLAIQTDKPIVLDLNGATLLGNASETGEIYSINNTSNDVKIKNGTIDMGLSFEGGIFSNGYERLSFEHLTFKNLALAAGGSETGNVIPYTRSGASIFLINTKGIRITDCNFVDCWNENAPGQPSIPFQGGGLIFWSCQYAWINNLYYNHVGGGINISKSQHFYIDNTSMNDIHDNGFYIQDDLYQVFATDPNTIYNINISNISIIGADEGITFTVCRNFPENGELANVKITNAHFENCGTSAIYARKGSGLQVYNATFKNCVRNVRANALYLYNDGAGPDYYLCTDMIFSGITSVNDLICGVGTGGAEYQIARSDRISIHNVLLMGLYATTADYAAIRFTYCDDCLVDNARIIGPVSGTVLTRGVYLNASTNCTVINPKVTNALTAKVTNSGGSGNVVSNLWP